jgi:hypothetical protein
MTFLGLVQHRTHSADSSAADSSDVLTGSSSSAPTAAASAPSELQATRRPLIQLPPRRPAPSMRALFLERELTAFESLTERLVQAAAQLKVHQAFKVALSAAYALPTAHLASKWWAGVPISLGSDVAPLLTAAVVLGGLAGLHVHLVRHLDVPVANAHDEPAPAPNRYPVSNARAIPQMVFPNWAQAFIGRDDIHHTEQVKLFLDTVIQLKHATHDASSDRHFEQRGLHISDLFNGLVADDADDFNVARRNPYYQVKEDLADLAGNSDLEKRMRAARVLSNDEILGGRILTMFVRVLETYVFDAVKIHHLQDYSHEAWTLTHHERRKSNHHFSADSRSSMHSICEKLLMQLRPENISHSGDFIFEDPSATDFFEVTTAKVISTIQKNKTLLDVSQFQVSKRAQKTGLVEPTDIYCHHVIYELNQKDKYNSQPEKAHRFKEVLGHFSEQTSPMLRVEAANVILQIDATEKESPVHSTLENIVSDHVYGEIKSCQLRAYFNGDQIKRFALEKLKDPEFEWDKYSSGSGRYGLKVGLLTMLSPANFSETGAVIYLDPFVLNAMRKISTAVVSEVCSKIQSSKVNLTHLLERAKHFGVGLHGQDKISSTLVPELVKAHVQKILKWTCDKGHFATVHGALESLMMTTSTHQARVNAAKNLIDLLPFSSNIFDKLDGYINGLHSRVFGAIACAYSRPHLSSDSHHQSDSEESNQFVDDPNKKLPFYNFTEYQDVMALGTELCEPTLTGDQYITDGNRLIGLRMAFTQRNIRLTKLLLDLSDTNPPSDNPDDVLDQLIRDNRAGLRA